MVFPKFYVKKTVFFDFKKKTYAETLIYSPQFAEYFLAKLKLLTILFEKVLTFVWLVF